MAFAVAYALAAWLGRASRIDGTPLALVWPAAAVGYLWLLWSAQRSRLRLDVPVLAFMAGVINWATGATAGMSLAFSAANALQALVAVLLVRRYALDWRLRTFGQLVLLVAGSAVGALVGALVGATAMAALLGVDLPSTLGAWVLRHAANTFVFGAVALRVADLGWRSFSSGRRTSEWVATGVVLTAMYLLVFGEGAPHPVDAFVLPLTVWIAIRFSTTVAAAHVLVAGMFVVSLTAAGRGPFQGESTLVQVALAQGFVTVLGLIALTLALQRDEREQLLTDLASQGQAATRQAALFDTVLETIDVAVVACDADGRVTLFNRAAREFHGAGSDCEAELARQIDMFDADGTTPLEPGRYPLEVALHDGRVHDHVIVIAPPGLPAHTVRADGRRLVGPQGEVLGAVVAQTDITRLQASERQFRQAFLAGPTPSARVNSGATVEQVNPALRRLVSLPTRHLVGRPLADLVVPEDRPRAVGLLADPASGPVEVRLAQAGGGVVWCEVSATSLSTDVEAGLLVQMLDVTSRRNRELQLERAAQQDPLTGLGNRAVAEARLEQLSRRPDHEQLLLAYLDLDGFKQVNDTHGHAAGDAVLKAVACRLRDLVRTGDQVVRLGGDEFLLLCAVSADEAGQAAAVLPRRLETAVAEPVEHDGLRLVVGVSAGILVARGGSDPADVLSAADQAMYEVKRARKGQPTATPADREARRLAALRGLDVLDTAPDPLLDDLVQVAALVAGTPTALVSLIDEQRQWVKARCGSLTTETPRDVSFCTHVADNDAELHVHDALADPRFQSNPRVTGGPRIRSYAGFPLRTPDGHVLGSLCAIGREPGTLDVAQRAAMRLLARQVTARLTVGRHSPQQVAVALPLPRSEQQDSGTAGGAADRAPVLSVGGPDDRDDLEADEDPAAAQADVRSLMQALAPCLPAAGVDAV